MFALEDGHIGLIVGDCVGQGLAAASVMGQLRSACRALLPENASPGAALAGLDRFAARLPGAQCTTAFCAVLNPDSGELVYSRAGHPPPILVHADRTTEMLDEGRALPLGVRPDWSRSEARVTTPPRATLVLYTDGLVERRREALDKGIACAANVVQDGRDSPWTTWQARSCPAWHPAAAIRTTSPCCSTVSPPRWRWTFPPM